MKPPLCTTLIVVALLASPLPPPNTLAAQGPHLSRRLPAVEVAILKALRESGLEEGVERIAADTNGQLVVASDRLTVFTKHLPHGRAMRSTGIVGAGDGAG